MWTDAAIAHELVQHELRDAHCMRQQGAEPWLWRDPALRPSLPVDADGRLIPALTSPPLPSPPLAADQPRQPSSLPASAEGAAPVNCGDDATQPGCGQAGGDAAPTAVSAVATTASKVRCWSPLDPQATGQRSKPTQIKQKPVLRACSA